MPEKFSEKRNSWLGMHPFENLFWLNGPLPSHPFFPSLGNSMGGLSILVKFIWTKTWISTPQFNINIVISSKSNIQSTANKMPTNFWRRKKQNPFPPSKKFYILFKLDEMRELLKLLLTKHLNKLAYSNQVF